MEENFFKQTKKELLRYYAANRHNSNLLARLFIVVIRFITNIYLVFVPTSGTELLNAWNFLSDECDKGIFSYVNEVTFGDTKEGGGLVARGASPVFRGLELAALPS